MTTPISGSTLSVDGAAVRRQRKARGLGLRELARMTAHSGAWVTALECSEMPLPVSMLDAANVAAVLCVELGQILAYPSCGHAPQRKGAAGERETAQRWSEALGVSAVRSAQGQRYDGAACADVEWPGCPLWVEVKRGHRVNWRAALTQAETAAGRNGQGRVPVVCARDDRDEAVIVMRERDWLPMARAWLEVSR